LNNPIIILTKKIVCLAIIFNSIIGVLLVADVLYLSYVKNIALHPFCSYLLENNLFLFIVIASALNIVAAKSLGNVNLRRIKFHHYFYGFVTSISSFVFVALFAPTYLFALLMVPILIPAEYGSSAAPISAAFLLVYGGMTLIIDDIQDMSLRLADLASTLKRKIRRFGRTFEVIHLFSCIASIIIVLRIFLQILINEFHLGEPVLLDLPSGILILNLLITSIWGLGIIKKRFWLRNPV